MLILGYVIKLFCLVIVIMVFNLFKSLIVKVILCCMFLVIKLSLIIFLFLKLFMVIGVLGLV